MTNNTLNPVIENILNRKSVRNYIQKEILADDLMLLLRAGMAAPSARDLRPWNFIAITNRDVLNQLADGLQYGKMLYQACAAIIVCGIPSKGTINVPDYWVQDCSAATQNILLACESLGFGAVWLGIFPRQDRLDFIKTSLNIPENGIPLNVISIGYPIGNQLPKDKFDENNIHWNKW